MLSGPSIWQIVDLGQTSVSVRYRWVYNDSKEGELKVNASNYRFFIAKFPDELTPEWLVVDLLNNRLKASLSLSMAEPYLKVKLLDGSLDSQRLFLLSEQYGTEECKEFLCKLCKNA